MFKLTDAADLEKAGRSIGGFFTTEAADLEKNYAFHKAMANHHTNMAAHHDGLAKAHHDIHASLGNDHEHKAFHAKAAGHHADLHKEHTAAATTHSGHAETMKVKVDTMKALASEWGGVAVLAAKAAGDAPAAGSGSGGGMKSVNDMLTETSQALMAKTLASFETDPVVQETIRNLCLKQVGAVLGGTMVPDRVSGVITHFPGITPIPRVGAPERPARPNVSLEFEKLVAVPGDDDEEGTF